MITRIGKLNNEYILMYAYKEIKQVHLEITQKCQASCPMCDRNKNGGEVNQYLTDAELSLSDVHRIFPPEFVRQLDKIYMCGNHGDPIMAKDTLEIMQYFRSCNPNMKLNIITNGGARSSEWWHEIAKVVTQVEFSVDGLEDTNHLYRQGVSWDKVENAIESFTSAGGNAKWTFLVFNYNEHQVEEAERYSKLLGVNTFVAKKSGRFFSTSKLQGKDDHQALSRKGELTTLLSPPSDPKYQNKALGKESQIIEIFGSMSRFLDKVEISCKASKSSEVYVSSEGLVFPCCWTAGRMYKWWRGPQEEQIWEYINRVGLDNINAKKVSIQDIVEGEFFNSIESSWGIPSCGAGKLEVCALKCNKEFDPYSEQWKK